MPRHSPFRQERRTTSTRLLPIDFRSVFSVLIAATPLAVSPAWADSAPTLAVGGRVRVVAPSVVDGRIEGTLVAADQASIVISRPDQPPLSLSRKAIARLDVSTGRHRQITKGMAYGVVIGGVWMAVACAVYADCNGWASPIAGGAVSGALLGTGIGAAIKRDRWQTVPLNQVQVVLVPVRRGAGVALSVRF